MWKRNQGPPHVPAGRDSCEPETGGTQLLVSVSGTQMLRMRSFGKDRWDYDVRNTGLRHNRPLPRCRKGVEQSRSHLATALISRSTRVRHTVLCDHLQSKRTNHQPLSHDQAQTSERSLQSGPQSNARLFMRRKATKGHVVPMQGERFADRHDNNPVHGATFIVRTHVNHRFPLYRALLKSPSLIVKPREESRHLRLVANFATHIEVIN